MRTCLGSLGLVLLVTGEARTQQPEPEALFRAGTRLVEVEVIVRDRPVRPPGARAWFDWVFNSGPPFGAPGSIHRGLTQDDFTLLDQDTPQRIAVFRENLAAPDKLPPLAPGVVSNRQDRRGEPAKGATVVLVDFLNTRFGCRAYERMGMASFLKDLRESDSPIALYTLGAKLHYLHGLADDPKKLMDLAENLSLPRDQLPPDLDSAMGDLGDVTSVGGMGGTAESVHAPITFRAVQTIIQSMAGVPGRKNLIWVLEDTRRVPPAVMMIARRSNIVVYPVLARLLGSGLGAGPDASCGGGEIPPTEAFAALTGARAFFDVNDLTSAVRATEEDVRAGYVLGFYPPEEMLDGKYHRITVRLSRSLEKLNLEIHFRPAYLATKTEVLPPAPSLAQLFQDPLEASGIGLSGQATPEPGHAGRYDVSVVVDLHDVRLEHQDGRFKGAIDLSVLEPGDTRRVRTYHVGLDFAERLFADALQNGYRLQIGDLQAESGEIRVAVRDRATGLAGSLRIPASGTPVLPEQGE